MLLFIEFPAASETETDSQWNLYDQNPEQTVYVAHNLLYCIHATDGTRRANAATSDHPESIHYPATAR